MSYRRKSKPSKSKPVRRKNDAEKPTIQEQLTTIPVTSVVVIGALTAIAGGLGTALFSWIRGRLTQQQMEIAALKAAEEAKEAEPAPPSSPPAARPMLKPYNGVYTPDQPQAHSPTIQAVEEAPPTPASTQFRSVEELRKLEQNLLAWQERLSQREAAVHRAERGLTT